MRKLSFFLYIALIGLAAVLIGFARTFIIPISNGSFKAPTIVHIHGAFAFGWIFLFLIQTSLIHFRKYNIHQILGILGVIIAAGVLITMIPTGVYVVERDLAIGLEETSYSTLLGVLTSGIMYFTLVFAGVLNRNRPEVHKRLMLLSTIVVLWPAWFRFRHYFPSVPRPDIWFAFVLADSLIIIAWVWDKLKNGGIHPVLKYVGLFIILEQAFEIYIFDTPLWRSSAKWLYGLVAG